jgi:glycosyltransferase involved in cell wall biosynthesis
VETRISPGPKIGVGVIIPAFKVRSHIVAVVNSIGQEVTSIIVVDDACPERSGDFIASECSDPRLVVLKHTSNRGVGAAMKTGYSYGMSLGLEVFVKVDGDGQMDVTRIAQLIEPISQKQADYTKGNRFFNIEQVKSMPKKRIFGNIVLSFFSKISSGYWNLFDPNNGFTAINRVALEQMQFEKVSDRYFFESDMLFRLNLANAVVMDIPMPAIYGEETSSLSIFKTLFEFPLKHSRNFLKRIIYSYALRDFSIASLELIFGTLLSIFGIVYGLVSFLQSYHLGQSTQVGTLILVTLSCLSGLQLLLSFVSYDIQTVPRIPLCKFTNPIDKWNDRKRN